MYAATNASGVKNPPTIKHTPEAAMTRGSERIALSDALIQRTLGKCNKRLVILRSCVAKRKSCGYANGNALPLQNSRMRHELRIHGAEMLRTKKHTFRRRLVFVKAGERPVSPPNARTCAQSETHQIAIKSWVAKLRTWPQTSYAVATRNAPMRRTNIPHTTGRASSDPSHSIAVLMTFGGMEELL